MTNTEIPTFDMSSFLTGAEDPETCQVPKYNYISQASDSIFIMVRIV